MLIFTARIFDWLPVCNLLQDNLAFDGSSFRYIFMYFRPCWSLISKVVLVNRTKSHGAFLHGCHWEVRFCENKEKNR